MRSSEATRLLEKYLANPDEKRFSQMQWYARKILFDVKHCLRDEHRDEYVDVMTDFVNSEDIWDMCRKYSRSHIAINAVFIAMRHTPERAFYDTEPDYLSILEFVKARIGRWSEHPAILLPYFNDDVKLYKPLREYIDGSRDDAEYYIHSSKIIDNPVQDKPSTLVCGTGFEKIACPQRFASFTFVPPIPSIDTTNEVSGVIYNDSYDTVSSTSIRMIKDTFYMSRFGGVYVGIIPNAAFDRYLYIYTQYLRHMSFKIFGDYTVVMGNVCGKIADNKQQEFLSNNLWEFSEHIDDDTYIVPSTYAIDIKFLSYQLNPELIDKYVDMNDSVRALEEYVTASIVDDKKKLRQPMLPYSPGQLSLVLVAGAVDGEIKENLHYSHYIKGSVTKSECRVDPLPTDGDSVQRRTIFSHGAAINSVGASGDFKRLL